MGMRRGRDNGWLFDANDHMIALNLGSDFCAEHEWGVKELYQTLGIAHDENVLGIERYRVTLPDPACVVYNEKNKNNASLYVIEPFDVRHNYFKEENYDRELKGCRDEELATAWCGKSFGIRVKKPKNIKHLRRIHKALLEKKAVIWLGGGGVFHNAGLVIGIIDAIPADRKQEMYNAHVDANKLSEASNRTGIKERIDTLNNKFLEEHRGCYERPCGYYSLKPAWRNSGNSAHPVMYWLNPMQQDKYASGWYTVEQLEQWIDGKGPVIKPPKEKTKAEVEQLDVLGKVLDYIVKERVDNESDAIPS